jgi:hypothetical protein
VRSTIDTDIWDLLSDFSVGRVNIQIYFDAISSYLYAFFGKIGSISAGFFSGVLGLVGVGKGWLQVIYINRCDFNFDYVCSVSPLFKIR